MAAKKKPLGFPAGNPRGILDPKGVPLTGAEVKKYAAIDKQSVKQARAYLASLPKPAPKKPAAKKPAAKPAAKPAPKKPVAAPVKLTREQKNLASMKTQQSKPVQKRKAK